MPNLNHGLVAFASSINQTEGCVSADKNYEQNPEKYQKTKDSIQQEKQVKH
jgi:hypothetical protein